MLRYLFIIFWLDGVFGVCPPGWQPYNGNCYLFSSALQSFGAAAEICRSFGAYLVEIDDDLEDKFLLQKVNELHDPKQAYWCGGNDLEIESDYRWLHSGAPITYTKWAQGQPNNWEHEDCISLWMPSQGLWHDADCEANLHFICEKVDESIGGTIIG